MERRGHVFLSGTQKSDTVHSIDCGTWRIPLTDGGPGPEDLALPPQAVSSVTQPAVNRSGTYLWAGPPGWEALGLSRRKLLDLAVDLMWKRKKRVKSG